MNPNNYIKLGKKLFPLNRSLTGKDTLKTLKIIKTKINKLKIKKFNSGKKVYDWKIPYEWNVVDAYVKDKNNKKIINFKKNNLHLINYSTYVKKIISKNNLLARLFSLKKLPKAIPYHTSYYKKFWGFCLSHYAKLKIIKKYKDLDNFFVFINAKFKKKGKMYYGELILPGISKKEILISTYICHPSMANNELSGILVTLAIAKYFQKKKLKRTLRIVFLPETIGSIAYIHKNYKILKKNIIGGYVLSCIGDNRNFSYLQTKYGNAYSDIAAHKAFQDLKIKYKKFPFLKRGSDERQYNSPFVELKIGSIMRTKYGEYKEYHTSLDNFKIVTAKGIEGGYKIAKKAIQNLINLKLDNPKNEKKLYKKLPITNTICEPNLGSRGLYETLDKKEKSNIKFKSRDILNFLQYADGTNNLHQISKIIRLDIKKVKKLYKLLKIKKIIKNMS